MNKALPPHFVIAPEVGRALNLSLPVVALESAVLTHGLPKPHNLSLAYDIEQEIRNKGVTPATIGVLDGKVTIGMSPAQVENLVNQKDIHKIGRRDFALAILKKESGGTTVAGTMIAAHRAGLKVFATGGIGGVHPHPSLDVSSDLPTLAEIPLIVICSGAKAFLDLPATLEYLETWGVPVIGYGTNDFPAFYSRESGCKIATRLDTPQEIVGYASMHWGLGMKSAVIVTQPPPSSAALPREKVNAWILQAQREATEKKILGQALTPFILQRMGELSNGETLRTNLALLLNNAQLAAEIARLLSAGKHQKPI